jgi:hypothetical protein
VTDVRYQNLDTFAVVKQPFTEQLIFPSYINNEGRNVTDSTLLAPDCFHLSQMGFARCKIFDDLLTLALFKPWCGFAGANALWNNMLEPIGKKSTNWVDTFTVFKCPSDAQPYLFTKANSSLNESF